MKFKQETILPKLILIAVTLAIAFSVLSSGIWLYGYSKIPDVDTRFYESEKLHFSAATAPAIKVNARFQFAFCGDPHVCAHHAGNFPFLRDVVDTNQIDFVIFPGDLTEQGKIEEYFQFKELADSTGAGYLVTVGNHDLYKNGWRLYSDIFGPSHYTFEISNSSFIVIDSADGRLGEAQMAWLEKALSKARGEHIFVISHDPVFSEKHGVYHLSDKSEQEKLKDLFSRYGVDYVLSGHYHGFVTIEYNGVNYITSGSFGTEPLDSGIYHFLVFTVNGPIVTYKIIDIEREVTYREGTV